MIPKFPEDLFDHPRFREDDPEPVPLRMSEQELHNELQYIGFYKKLQEGLQKEFRGRVREFVANKIIIGVNLVQLPDAVRAFIAASAIQLTFGLEEWWFYHIHTIRLYPKEFYSRVNDKYLKGGAGRNGIVFFSWKDYLDGYADQENGINLGLHEFAHALMINMHQGAQAPEFHASYQELVQVEADLLPMVRNGEIGYLRKYAGTNMSEFFAVSVEHFFEQPVEFKKMLPVLYHALAELLQQDPAAGRVGPEPPVEHFPVSQQRSTAIPTLITYEDDKPKKKKKPDEEERAPKRNFRFARWHWSLTVLLTGILAAPLPLGFLIHVTFVPAVVFWLIYLGFVTGSAILYYKRLVPTEALNLTQFVFFLLLGIGPVGLTSVLLVNRAIPILQETEDYRLTGQMIYQPGGAVVELEGKAYYDLPALRSISLPQIQFARKGAILHIHFRRGLFGMRYYEGTELNN